MRSLGSALLMFALSGFAGSTFAQSSAQMPMQASGTLVIIPAHAEVKHVNDEAHVVFMIEERDADKAVAATRVNQKMKQGTEVIRREDPQATLQTRGYYSYPVYPEDHPPHHPQANNNKRRQPVSWRVGQYLEVKTSNIASLPRMAAAAQRILALNGLQFSLSEAASKKLDSQRIEATYRNLMERIAAVAKAMGRNPADAILETVDFEGTGAYVPQDSGIREMKLSSAMNDRQMQSVDEPSFEPGETTLQMNVVGKVRFR